MNASPTCPSLLCRSYAASPICTTASSLPPAASARRSGIVDFALVLMPMSPKMAMVGVHEAVRAGCVVKVKGGDVVPPTAPTVYVYVVAGVSPERYTRCMVCTLLESENGNVVPEVLKAVGRRTDTWLVLTGARVLHMTVNEVSPPASPYAI